MPEEFISIGETMGIEFEFDRLNSNSSVPKIFRKTHDASIETDVKILGIGIPVNNIPNELIRLINYSNIVIGTELVSPILNSEDESFLEAIKSVTQVANRDGEPDISLRSGIHFHISLPNPTLTILKTLIRLGRCFEKLFFTIGGMGYTNRGEKNDAIYFRPITKYGPHCIPYRNNYAQVFNVNELLKTKTRNDFWFLYGDCQNHQDRYNPIRYHWLNLYPMNPYGQYKGTVEFRVFNKSLNPLFIYAVANLCKKFVHLTLRSSFSSLKELELLDEYSIYDDIITKEDLFRQLIRLHDLTNFEEKTLKILMEILDQSNIPLIEPGYVHTHIRTRLNAYWQNNEYIPEVISSVRTPNYVDIHTLRGER